MQRDRAARAPLALSGSDTARTVLAVLDNTNGKKPNCPGCGAIDVQRWGFTDGLQRFRCKTCRRSFNLLTGTPLARLRRRDLWLDHAQILHEGASIRVAARRLGLHRNTSFRWRHRWLTNPRDLQAEVFTGAVGVDTVRLRERANAKRSWRRVVIPERLRNDTAARTDHRGSGDRGPSVLVACDLHGAVADAVLSRVDAQALSAVLGPLLDPGPAVLWSPGAPGFRTFAGPHGDGMAASLPDGAAAQAHRSNRFPLDHARAYMVRLGQWMRRFRGVSIGHLPNYLGWRRLLERAGERLAPEDWLRIASGRYVQQPTVTRSGAG